MSYATFLKLVEDRNKKASESTLRLWYHIYMWVSERGYADTADSPEFVEHVQLFRRIGIATIGRHLRSMSEGGLLSRHNLRRQLSIEVKQDLLNPLNIFFGGSSSLPSSFARYTLVGQPCPLEFKSASRTVKKIEKLMSGLHDNSEGDEGGTQSGTSVKHMTIKRIVTNISASDPSVLDNFYRGIFGLDLAMDHGWIRTYSGSAKTSVQVSFASQGGSGTPMPDLSIEVDNLDEALRRVQEEKIPVEYGPTSEPWGVRRFYVRDPLGKLINVLEHESPTSDL
mgnify:CR=1 FL=1